MSFTRWLSAMQRRFNSQIPARRRRVNPLSGIHDWLLEDRCLMSSQTIYVATTPSSGTPFGPYTLTNEQATLGPPLIFVGGTAKGQDWGTVPTKSFTFTNNGADNTTKQTIYPFLYSPNTEQKYDPIDTNNEEYRIYIGYQQNGQYLLGLPFGDTITINVPLVFWNGGRADIATDGANLIPQPNQPGVFTPNPYQFYYTAQTHVGTEGVISSNDNGVLLYYHNPGAPNDPSPAAEGQLTEWTIRDQGFLTKVSQYNVNNGIPAIDPSQLITLINYDVSYVDDMVAPVAMVGNNVPVPIRYTQGNLTASQSQDQLTTTLSGALDSAVFNLLTTTFPYNTNYEWDVRYNTPGGGPTYIVGKVTAVDANNNTVTVTSNTPVSGLPLGTPATYDFYTYSVTQDYGWTGANNSITQMQKVMTTFTTTNSNPKVNPNSLLGQYFGGLGWPSYYNPGSNSLLKIPSGASLLINSPLTGKTSPYTNGNYYLLTSGNNGNQILYNAHEDLTTTGQPNPIPAGTQVTFNVSGEATQASLTAIQNSITNDGKIWVLSNGLPNSLNPIATINSVDPTNLTITVTLNQALPNPSPNPGYSYTIVEQPSDPYTTQLTNLWYSWAQYYVTKFPGPSSLTISNVTVSPDTDVKSDTRILTFTADNQSNAAQLMVGMKVTGAGINNLTTILKIVPTTTNMVTTYTVYLSAPVPQTTTSFTFLAPALTGANAGVPFTNDPGLQLDLVTKGAGFTYEKDAIAFGANVYEMLSTYGTISQTQLKNDLLPNLSMAVVYEAIGGNVGHLPTALPVDYVNISADVRDLGKSVLRGVSNFLTTTPPPPNTPWNVGYWYPPPGETSEKGSIPYNVWNLDPFVWFVHQALGLSGYGFSFDDDASDIGANGTSTLSTTYAAGTSKLPVDSQWYASTPWGTVTGATATISPITSGQYAGLSMLTIQPTAQGVKAYWQVAADDPKNGVVGAYITGNAGNGIPAGTRLLANGPSNLLQYVLSAAATTTTTPISITFTGYKPSATLASPPPTSSPPPPPSNNQGGGGFTNYASPAQALFALAVDEALLTADQVVEFVEATLGPGLVPDLVQLSSIGYYSNAILANPEDQTLLGQYLIDFIRLETLLLLFGLPLPIQS